MGIVFEGKVIYEKRDKIAFVTMNRPEVHNALDGDALQLLERAWLDFRDDPDVQVAIVTGAGDKAFSAGGDLRTHIPKATEGKLQRRMDTQVRATLRGMDLWKPVIAAVNGYCVAGGMELLCGTDIRVAAEHATFAVAEVRWGVFPGGGTTVRLPRQVPFCRAMEMLLVGGTGGRITAQEALQFGLVNKVVPLPELMPTAINYAQRILENGPLAVQAIKRSVLLSLGVPTDIAYYIESFHSRYVFETEDAKEGMKAFQEKRKANWKSR